jgi:polyisoprenoid-binding protein YceI
MHAMTRTGLLLGLCLGLAACPRPVQPPPPAPSVPPVQPQPPKPGDIPTPSGDIAAATIYQIDPDASELHILVYRGGTFARLGHNHVMSSQSVSGRIWMQPRFAASGFELSFPVAELIVDDAAARRAAGSDFPPDIAAADKEGTRQNMLRPEVLDAERHPRIELKSAKVGGSLQAPQVTARITIKQASREVAVPVVVAIDGNRLSASGEFELLQTDFGIQPFSVALGAVAVKDALLVRFKLIADRR